MCVCVYYYTNKKINDHLIVKPDENEFPPVNFSRVPHLFLKNMRNKFHKLIIFYHFDVLLYMEDPFCQNRKLVVFVIR